jgi:hypothetical protein
MARLVTQGPAVRPELVAARREQPGGREQAVRRAPQVARPEQAVPRARLV